MKPFTIMASIGALGLTTVLGVTMAKTNPHQAEYEDYAVQRLSEYLKSDVCNKTTKLLERLMNYNCDKIVDSANPQIRQLLSATTERQDFFLFSIYRTELKISDFIPSYKFETVGAFNNFYTYTAQEQ
ncbi:hypothetical protein NOS3756_32710 [Nostoc sp. NIES-3756]|jgi:hypothetical protein|uniref:DUF4359 domain-containing protein n=1 Tax=Nostoc sp. NIES-3756 TaxID=1751286 RepID=UPI00071F72A0|nr:DUF4359 domain-containing protein [Nostoc sp. NIES-3756]BAT54303.1 hypothetical protein NOS3756_32710 [Nostoc sp. NIES-3756]BAY37954.1 hypothetical protein NIES2111_22960 [Nostoc sp. NIES-2111]